MSKKDRGTLGIISCEAARPFTDLVVEHLEKLFKKQSNGVNLKYIDSTEITFANGEIKTIINEPIRGHDVYVFQLMDSPLSSKTVNDNLIALLTAVNATFNSDAASVTAVIPQFPNSRQERRKGRESLTASMMASFLEVSGANRVLTIDIHAEAIQGFFKKAKLDNLHASSKIIEFFKENNILNDNTILVAPDVGSAETVRFYSRILKKEMAIIVKERDYSVPSTIISTKLVGNVKDKDVIIIDDMIATGGTLIAACETLKEFGARNINVAVTFPFFNRDAVTKIDAAHKLGIIDKVIGTNAVFRGEDFKKNYEWYAEVDVSSLFAEVIYRINHMQSISEILA